MRRSLSHRWAAALALLALYSDFPAAAANLAEYSGRWSCMPTEPLAPQIEIDFAEHAYRRCDQSICSTYDLDSSDARLTSSGETIEIAFAPRARFAGATDGRWFVETVTRGPHEFRSTGTCRFHANEAEPVSHGTAR